MKTAGLILMFLSATAAGFIKANTYKESEKEIASFIEMLYFIKHEISFYLTPQNKIYEKLHSRILESNGFLACLRDFSTECRESPLLCAIETCDGLKCGDEVLRILKEFAVTFGTLSVEEQCRRCDRTISELEEIHKTKKSEAIEKTRLCRSVGCMIGLGLVLLLW